MSINELAKKAQSIYKIPSQTINNCHSEQRHSNIGHAIAIANILRVPFDRLLREDVESAEGYDDLCRQLETTARAFQKAYGIGITYEIYRSDTLVSFKLMCTVTSQLETSTPKSTTYKLATQPMCTMLSVVISTLQT